MPRVPSRTSSYSRTPCRPNNRYRPKKECIPLHAVCSWLTEICKNLMAFFFVITQEIKKPNFLLFNFLPCTVFTSISILSNFRGLFTLLLESQFGCLRPSFLTLKVVDFKTCLTYRVLTCQTFAWNCFSLFIYNMIIPEH